MYKNLREIIIATGNRGKYKEIFEYLSDLPFELKSLADFDIDTSSLIEDGKTYKENALIKAKFFYDVLGETVISDDSGIIVEAFKDELGVYTRRWGAGENVSDTEWIEFFLKRMDKEKNKEAYFQSCVCLYNEKLNIEEYFYGECVGTILNSLDVDIIDGLPLSSIFIPKGYDVVHSAMPVDQKNLISHRGKALKKLRDYLLNFSAN